MELFQRNSRNRLHSYTINKGKKLHNYSKESGKVGPSLRRPPPSPLVVFLVRTPIRPPPRLDSRYQVLNGDGDDGYATRGGARRSPHPRRRSLFVPSRLPPPRTPPSHHQPTLLWPLHRTPLGPRHPVGASLCGFDIF